MISRNEIKTRVKSKCEYEISKECLEEICKIVSEFTDSIIIKCIDEFNRINRLREIQNLPKLKRLDNSILINLLDNLFNSKSNLLIGEVGQYNIETTFSKQRW